MASASILSGEEALDPARNFDFVIAYPHTSNISVENGRIAPRLSLLSAMSIDAAAAVWLRHPGSKVIIPGESPFGTPDTGDLMIARAMQNSNLDPRNVNDSFVALHSSHNGIPLNNTYLQTEAVVKYLDSNNQNGLYISLSYHLLRLGAALVAYGVTPLLASAEDILEAQGSREHERFSQIMERLKRSESIGLLMTEGVGLPRGQLPNIITKFIGARLVDVTENADGNLFLENTTARRKAKLLRKQLGALMQNSLA